MFRKMWNKIECFMGLHRWGLIYEQHRYGLSIEKQEELGLLFECRSCHNKVRVF